MDYNKKRKFTLLIIAAVLIVVSLATFFIVKKITSKEYKLEKLGYSNEEITVLLENKTYTFEEISNMEYNENFVKLLNEKYFIKKNLSKYLEYIDMKPKVSELDTVTLSDIVAIVNVGAHEKFYSNVKATDISKDNLMLVNKYTNLDKEYAPDDIVKMNLQYAFNNNSIRADVYNAIKELIKDAKKEDLTILANSSYRTYDSQEKVYNNYKASRGEKGADLIAARPGHSEHQTGLALDLSTLSSTSATFESTDEFSWLQEHAHEYGFILRYPKGKKYLTGFDYESWHYRYVGVDVATEIKELGITFDEYYAYYLDK